jgi:hypothetical protein
MLEARPTARAIVYLVGHFKIVKASAQKCGGVSLRACRNPQRYAYKTTGVSFMRRSTCHLVVLGTGVRCMSVYGNEFQQQPLFVLCR